MYILYSDLESVFLPELWIEIAEQTGIEELKLTTRDISDLDVLTQKRIDVLRENKVDFKTIIEIIKKSEPLEGAVDFLRWARETMPVIILSDTFWEFVSPILNKIEHPTIICNSLEVDKDGFISGYTFREGGKKGTVEALQQTGLRTIAIGDSYNDIGMLEKAEKAILFNATEEMTQEFPQFLAINNYGELKSVLENIAKNKIEE